MCPALVERVINQCSQPIKTKKFYASLFLFQSKSWSEGQTWELHSSTMDSFLDKDEDTLQIFSNKRNLDAMLGLSKRHDHYFKRTRHNLLEDFNETPTKQIIPEDDDRLSGRSIIASDNLRSPGMSLTFVKLLIQCIADLLTCMIVLILLKCIFVVSMQVCQHKLYYQKQ